jgi:hypothetical protein
VLHVRSAAAAAGAGIAHDGATSERRALVTALRWLVEHGMVRELDRSVTGHETDADADALLEPRPVAARFAPVLAVADADDDGEQQSLL